MKKFIWILVFNLSFTLFAQELLPNTTLKTLSGATTTLAEIAAVDDLIVVSLWATWCVPCKNELDAVADVYDDWVSETGVKYYAVSIDDSRTAKRVRPMVNGKGWEFEILLDENSDLKRAFGVSTVPYTIIIKSGEIVYKHTGYTPGFEDELYDQIVTLKD
ncbi:MAG: TlpA disulfide reductase family protein [Flavobacteriaceae bacterium]|nr:TlpA family protein disulfide reductase [Flavobacteriaceae bacterium]MDA7727797.1 TlpA family protein disulfide reductase [Flavobacteriaceae bacterium]MDB4178485.1 TlpA family protein disulfide reductase [Flavobacteriaceae bacterium]MDG1309065.1 TlpA disulfide reductase family protein [Flavobacteriaceae bacterium]